MHPQAIVERGVPRSREPCIAFDELDELEDMEAASAAHDVSVVSAAAALIAAEQGRPPGAGGENTGPTTPQLGAEGVEVVDAQGSRHRVGEEGVGEQAGGGAEAEAAGAPTKGLAAVLGRVQAAASASSAGDAGAAQAAVGGLCGAEPRGYRGGSRSGGNGVGGSGEGSLPSSPASEAAESLACTELLGTPLVGSVGGVDGAQRLLEGQVTPHQQQQQQLLQSRPASVSSTSSGSGGGGGDSSHGGAYDYASGFSRAMSGSGLATPGAQPVQPREGEVGPPRAPPSPVSDGTGGWDVLESEGEGEGKGQGGGEKK